MVPESKKTCVTFPFERQAMDGDEMPDGLHYPDQILYLSLRMLYSQLKQQIIDRDTAVREKRRIVKEYECYQSAENMGNEWVRVIQKTELARAEYRKERTIENANRLILAIEGRLP